MDIKNIQGMNAYTANTQTADTASVRNNNQEVTGAQPNQESTQTPQQAFKVEITQEAMTLQAQRQKNLAEAEEEQAGQTSQYTQLYSSQNQQGSRIDTVA